MCNSINMRAKIMKNMPLCSSNSEEKVFLEEENFIHRNFKLCYEQKEFVSIFFVMLHIWNYTRSNMLIDCYLLLLNVLEQKLFHLCLIPKEQTIFWLLSRQENGGFQGRANKRLHKFIKIKHSYLLHQENGYIIYIPHAIRT